MTSFALLISNGDSNSGAATDSSASFATNLFHDLAVGVTLVCFAVLALALVLVLRREGLRKSEYILLNICVASIGLYSTFLGAVERNGAGRTSCTVRAAILHYFLLSLLLLLLVEGLHLWLSFVRVLPGTVPLSKMITSMLFIAWLIPVPVVAITAAAANGDYITDNSCWLDTSSAAGAAGFLVPMCAVVLINAVVYVLAIRNIQRMGKDSYQLKASVLFFVLLGLPWGILFLGRIDSSQGVHYVVSLIFLAQSIFLCVYHLHVNKRLRSALLSYVPCIDGANLANSSDRHGHGHPKHVGKGTDNHAGGSAGGNGDAGDAGGRKSRNKSKNKSIDLEWDGPDHSFSQPPRPNTGSGATDGFEYSLHIALSPEPKPVQRYNPLALAEAVGASASILTNDRDKRPRRSAPVPGRVTSGSQSVLSRTSTDNWGGDSNGAGDIDGGSRIDVSRRLRKQSNYGLLDDDVLVEIPELNEGRSISEQRPRSTSPAESVDFLTLEEYCNLTTRVRASHECASGQEQKYTYIPMASGVRPSWRAEVEGEAGNIDEDEDELEDIDEDEDHEYAEVRDIARCEVRGFSRSNNCQRTMWKRESPESNGSGSGAAAARTPAAAAEHVHVDAAAGGHSAGSPAAELGGEADVDVFKEDEEDVLDSDLEAEELEEDCLSALHGQGKQRRFVRRETEWDLPTDTSTTFVHWTPSEPAVVCHEVRPKHRRSTAMSLDTDDGMW